MQTRSDNPTATWMDTIPKDKKIGIVCPMYGYYVDSAEPQLDWQELSTVIGRLKSTTLSSYLVFTCESDRLSKNVKNVLIGRQKGGGMQVLEVDKYSTYSEYLNEGINYLLDETDCEFIITVNPWVLLREDSIDQMAMRLNTDNVDILSGVDLRKIKWGSQEGIPPEQFETFNFNPPQELINKEFDFNFWGMTRSRAQQLKIDSNYKTIFPVQFDIWGTAFSYSFQIVSSQYLPFYSFDVKFKEFCTEGEFEEDKAKFQQKWGFIPSDMTYDHFE